MNSRPSHPRYQLFHLVSRFPQISETFIAREIDALARTGRFDIALRSLFPAPDSPVHPIAAGWVPRLVRPDVRAAVGGLGWALRRRPRTLLGIAATVTAAHARRPGVLARALVTTALGTALARELGVRPEQGSDARRTRVHAHYATYPALAAWVCHRLTGVPYSFTAHAHDLYVDSSMLDRKVADAAAVVTISEYNRTLLDGLATGTPVTVVPCGIDVAAYPFRERTLPAAGPVRALCVASLQEYKGHRVLLDALGRGRPELARLELELIGHGPLRAELERQADALGIAHRVRFAGPRTESEVRDALDRADLFVLPSVVARDGQMEGLPVALMEALACGLPTVSTDLSGIPEIVQPGVTGLLATPGDPDALADALAATLADPAATAERARAGRALVERAFDAAASVTSLADLLTQPTAAGAGRRSIAAR